VERGCNSLSIKLGGRVGVLKVMVLVLKKKEAVIT
jgi:hypothetical protein